jgi:hypothetical protein
MIEVADAGRVFSVADDGAVSELSLAVYESMPASDPRLRHIAWTRRQAELQSLRVRGIETGFEPQRLRN